MTKKGSSTMKKSEIYKLAQIAVLKLQDLPEEDKLEALRVLMGDEKLARFGEEREAVQ